jgi:enamine deaminase RidA (YjgF/YER057c/UK114 family)
MIRISSVTQRRACLGAICLLASAQVPAALFPADDTRGQGPSLSGHPSRPQYVPGPKGAPGSSVVRSGNVLYLSGLLGRGPDGKIVGDVSAQTHVVMGRLKDVLARNDSSLAQLLHCTLIVTDIQTLPLVNTAYMEYFPEDRLPARTAFEASGLAANALVEVACIAAVNQPELPS